MTERHYIRQNDLEKGVEFTPDDQLIDYTTASTIKFRMMNEAGVTVVDATATTIIVAGIKKLRYAWVTGNTANAGKFSGFFRVTFPGARPLSFPNFENLLIDIEADFPPI